MRFDATLEAFVEALADPSAPPPAQTRGREGRPDARRFAVYRNNVAVGLIASVEMRYPVTRRLVGDDFFRGLARAFVAGNKPRSPVLIHWGADFPAFIEAFEPAREIPYLADVALTAYVSAIGEVALPVLLALGLGTRYAALGLLGMTAIIQLTVPDGWMNFHLPWAAMELAILTFGPGRIALDYLLGLDRVPRPG